MQSRQKKSIEMYERVQQFLGAYPPPASAAFTTQKQVLDDVVARLAVHYEDQSAGLRLSRQETQRIAALRRRIRDEILAPIAKVARAHRDVPGLARAMRTPRRQIATTRFIQEAVGIRKAVAGQAQLFVDSGQPEDFLARLDAAIAELRQSRLARSTTVETHVGARKGLVRSIRDGRKAVDILDTIVRAAFRGQDDVLAKWTAAKRVQRVRSGSPALETEPATDPATPDAQPSAAPVAA